MKCPLDGKRCYVKDPHTKDALIRDLPCKCRHGEFYLGEQDCPAYRKKKK